MPESIDDLISSSINTWTRRRSCFARYFLESILLYSIATSDGRPFKSFVALMSRLVARFGASSKCFADCSKSGWKLIFAKCLDLNPIGGDMV